ncbi:hypothetical protein AMELA_G00228850 [Ameiurus melas]|uniref:Uncharacterized protein n=1 Tax=Ameiurus melas TaxID=219545 RepID=A0A7J5ZZ20_AMEME|nr:hypothetical protein AMELA_G00228850 [Ameiurus melas]
MTLLSDITKKSEYKRSRGAFLLLFSPWFLIMWSSVVFYLARSRAHGLANWSNTKCSSEWRRQYSNGPQASSLGCEVTGISETTFQMCRRFAPSCWKPFNPRWKSACSRSRRSCIMLVSFFYMACKVIPSVWATC